MKATIKVSTLTILICMVFTQVASAQDVTDTPARDILCTSGEGTVGELAGVTEHTQTPQRPDGKRLYAITLESRGETITIDLWMFPKQAAGLRFYIGTTGVLVFDQNGDGTGEFRGWRIISEYMNPEQNEPLVPPDY